jgi:hypothetical protein
MFLFLSKQRPRIIILREGSGCQQDNKPEFSGKVYREDVPAPGREAAPAA